MLMQKCSYHIVYSAIQKIEQEKTNRDHTIRSLNDEIANQDEVRHLFSTK